MARFTVRRIAYNEGVERVFPLHSPRVVSVEVTREGAVRRAKLHYLRELSGKAARVKGKARSTGKRAEAEVEVAQATERVAAAEAEAETKAEKPVVSEESASD